MSTSGLDSLQQKKTMGSSLGLGNKTVLQDERSLWGALRSVSLLLKLFLVNKSRRRGHNKGLRKWGGHRVPPDTQEVGESAV